MSQSISFRQAAFVVLFLAVVQLLLQLSLLARGVEYVAASLVIDDTYYYLQTAWNTKQLGFVTFDGLHPTNGVQLLWFVIILVLALLAKTKTVLLFATLIVSFLLNALGYLVILRIGAIVRQPILVLFLAGLWALQSLPFRIYSMGMENSLHAFVFWCVIWQSVEFLIRVQNRVKPNFLGLTIVLILNVWTRLDSGLISAVLFAFCVGTLAYTNRDNLKLFLQDHGKAIVGSGLLAGLGLITQLSAFWVMGGSFLPVSALVKTNGVSRGLSTAFVDKLAEVITLGMPSILQGRFPPLALILLGVFGILLVIGARRVIPNQPKELVAFLNLWSCLLVGEILYHFYIAISGVQYTLYFIWYRSPSFIFWISTGSLLALFIFLHPRLSSLPSRFSRWAPVGLSVALFAVGIYMFAVSLDFTSRLYVVRYQAARWIAENSPPDAVFASWNAGQLGFFSDRSFINLDGVINNVDYFERVLRGPVSLTEYLSENNVAFVVDYDTYGELQGFPVIQTFPLDDESGRSIHIWQVSPELSSAP